MSVQSMCTGFSVNWQTPANSQDTSGGPVRGPFTTQAGPFACSIQPASGMLGLMSWMQREIRMTHQIYFAQNVGAVKAGHRFQTADGLRNFVIHSYGDEAGQGQLWVADVEEVLS